jgi:hypothetical protein
MTTESYGWTQGLWSLDSGEEEMAQVAGDIDEQSRKRKGGHGTENAEPTVKLRCQHCSSASNSAADTFR